MYRSVYGKAALNNEIKMSWYSIWGENQQETLNILLNLMWRWPNGNLPGLGASCCTSIKLLWRSSNLQLKRNACQMNFYDTIQSILLGKPFEPHKEV